MWQSASQAARKEMNMGDALLTVDDLNIEINVHGVIRKIVRHVSFAIEKGKTLCIVGESGCGKSLTALSLMNLLPDNATRTTHEMRFADVDLSSLSERQWSALRGKRIAMIFQDPMTSLNPVFTVETQLTDVMMRHKKVSKQQAVDRAKYLLERVGITNPETRLKQYPHELSGGLRQRVMIAMALMCDPDLLIADEPTTALDVTVQAELLQLLRDIQKEFGIGMIFISHDLGLVSTIADDVIVMYAGDIVEAAPASRVFSHAQHPYTEMLIRCIPRPGITQPKSVLQSIDGNIPSFDKDVQGCRFYDRCPVKTDACKNTDITMRADNGHRYLCLNPGQMAQTREMSHG
jgi:peptide/nickel transport system ATP-binding protein